MAPAQLLSWNEGPAKTAILNFVTEVTAIDGPHYRPPSERIAVFDNDGTLWCEQPIQVQIFFALARLDAMAAKDPGLRERQPYKAFLERDIKALHELGKKAVFEVAFATHAGMTIEGFDQIVRAWFETAQHPKLGRLFSSCTYQPQIELLDYLAANDFKTFIVSGGGVDFMRAFAEAAYGIPPERVIGSSVKLSYEMEGASAEIVKLAELNSFDDREVKPANIGLHIGRRPILAFGNSDGDLAMMRYTMAGDGSRLALLLHHDDDVREYAYDREFRLSPLVEALDRADEYGIQLVSMKSDWATVFVDFEPASIESHEAARVPNVVQ